MLRFHKSIKKKKVVCLALMHFHNFNTFFFQYHFNKNLYIRNLKYFTFNTYFSTTQYHLVFSTCQHKCKSILCTEKPVLNASFQDFWCTNINNHLICFEKTINMSLKAKNSLHTTRISSFNTYLSSFSKREDAKIYIIFCIRRLGNIKKINKTFMYFHIYY